MSDTTYGVDTTHTGVRLASLATILTGALLGSLVIMPTLTRMLGIGESFDVLLSCTGGPAIGIGAGWAVERYLRIVWPSGRQLEVDQEGITFRERSDQTIQIKWAEPVDVLSWHFVIRKGRMWIPQGWYCATCRLAQGGKAIILYAFMKPIDARAIAQWEAFPELISRKDNPGSGTSYHAQPDEGQEELWAAEKDRWEYGAEMLPTDFAALLAEIDRQVAGWPG